MTRELTVVIPARNASTTIDRAVRSALLQEPAAIVVVNHASADDTAARARAAGGDVVQIVEAPEGATLGAVRQLGLEAFQTPFGMWLDADDEALPGRAARLLQRLRDDESDLAFDEIELYDGAAGTLLKRLPIPDLLGEGRQAVRLFERNYLPGPGVPAFRTAAAKALGFDPAMHGAEDFDFLMRAVVTGSRISLERHVGYRQHAYPGTLSRNRENQAAMTRAALRKHEPATIEALFRRAGFTPRSIAWGMISFLILRGDYGEALLWLNRVPTGSRRDFYAGTVLAAMGRHADAVTPLRRALDDCVSPELLNNFGVVLAALDRIEEAADMFADAIYHFPGYSDANANLSGSPTRLTLLPLRDEAARSDYD